MKISAFLWPLSSYFAAEQFPASTFKRCTNLPAVSRASDGPE
jgi:hypothetical protein